MKKTAIIYCPNHRPFTSTSKRRREIEHALEKHHVDYDMIDSDSAEGISRLMLKLMDEGYRDIVIAGGDLALNEAVNCLMRVEQKVRESVNIGLIPNGTMNDFAAFWGFAYDNLDYCAESIAQHRVRKIDAGCIRYTNSKGEAQQKYFVNSINVGLLATIQRLRQQMRKKVWSRKIAFAASLVMLVFHKMESRMTYTINYITENHRVTTLCIGSAHGYGQTPNAVPYNGLLDITIVRQQPLTVFISGIYLYLAGKILMHKRVRPYRSREIELEVPSSTKLSIDGHQMETPVGKFKVTVEQEAINFIIEKR